MLIHYVTGSRADFGLMQKTLLYLQGRQEIELGIVVTGQHLNRKYGYTVNEIRATALNIVDEIPVTLSGAGGLEMGYALAKSMKGLLKRFSSDKPDLVLVLGDRGEMLSAAIAAVHCGICVGHIHGGEVSGTIDESFRHAISKLSHFHFVASEDAHDRLIKMGEKKEHVWTIGAPGLVGITEGIVRQADYLEKKFTLKKHKYGVLCVFHPVVQEADQAAVQFTSLLQMLLDNDCYGVILQPNSDAGGLQIEQTMTKFSHKLQNRFVILDHLARSDYLSCLANVDVLVGNSSSGIIEAASFGIPNLCVGSRQSGRLRSGNTIDCMQFEKDALGIAFKEALALKSSNFPNLFGNGNAHILLHKALGEIDICDSVLSKQIAY